MRLMNLERGMKVNIVICDNRLDYQCSIEQRILERFTNETLKMQLFKYSNSKKLYESLQYQGYDLAYIEVTIDNNSGLDIAKAILKVNPKCMIIFLSYEVTCLEEVFRLGAFQYIFKPINTTLFNTELNRAIEFYKSLDKRFLLHTEHGRYVAFQISKIKYVETYYCDLEIVTTDNKHRCDVKQKYALRSILCPRQFLQVNQSILVNMDYIHILTQKCVILTSGEVFNLSYKYTRDIHVKYQDYTLRKGDIM